MPFKSKAQARFLLSNHSPLSSAQKEEWKQSTNFSSLPERVASSNCVNCKGRTLNKNVTVQHGGNNRIFLKSNCTICGHRKSSFL